MAMTQQQQTEALLARMAALLRDCERLLLPLASRYAPTLKGLRALLAAYDARKGRDGGTD